MASDQYLKFSNFTNILVQSVPLMLVAFAQTLIVLTQGTDLSLGAQVSFCNGTVDIPDESRLTYLHCSNYFSCGIYVCRFHQRIDCIKG